MLVTHLLATAVCFATECDSAFNGPLVLAVFNAALIDILLLLSLQAYRERL